MMVANLSDLVEAIQGNVIPYWLHKFVTENKWDMVERLRITGEYTIYGPEGVLIHIKCEPKVKPEQLSIGDRLRYNLKATLDDVCPYI